MATAYVYPGVAQTFGVTLAPVADANSVVWTLRNNVGAPIAGCTNVAIANPANAVLVAIPIPGANQTITPPNLNETRYLNVSWTSGGVTYNYSNNYVVAPFMPIRAQPADVLTIIGANVTELADIEIDIMAAALYVQQDIGDALFTPGLTAGGLITRQINQLITIWAAFEVAPSIQLRIAQSEKNELAQFVRFNGLDISKWVDDITFEYYRIRGNVLGAPLVPNPTFVTFGPPRITMLPPFFFNEIFPLIPPYIDSDTDHAEP